MKKVKSENNFTKGNQNGITLIALIVTIIVLIIIAGISIATLTADNGVLRQTNLAKIAQIEGTAREQVKLATSAMRLAVAEARAQDNSYSAIAHSSDIQAKLLDMIKNDNTSLKKEGWGTEAEVNDNVETFTITYAGEDYIQACNNDDAKITYEIKLGQSAIEITNEVNATLKDQNQNDVEIDIGAGSSEEGGSGSGSGSDTGTTGYDAVGKVAIGDYVYFDVPYTDVYSSTGYDKYTGWRVIDDGQAHGSNEATGEIKLISTGTPLKYYYANDVVTGLNGLTTGFFSTTTATSGKYVWKANGFDEQDLATAFSGMSSIIAKYTGGETYTDDYTGAYTTTTVAAADQLKVRSVNLSDLNRARGASLTSTAKFTDTLYYNNIGDTWLASAYSTSLNGLRHVGSSGGVYGYDNYTVGVRSVVSLKSGIQVTTAEKVTDSNGTYWIMQ